MLLADNPVLIKLREKEYLKWCENFDGPKKKIDTKKKDIEQTANILQGFILEIIGE